MEEIPWNLGWQSSDLRALHVVQLFLLFLLKTLQAGTLSLLVRMIAKHNSHDTVTVRQSGSGWVDR